MKHTDVRADRRPLPGDAAYGPYNLALDPLVMDRYLHRARVERSQVAWDLAGAAWRGIKRLAASILPHRHDHDHAPGPLGRHYRSAG
jgi:hypothetical protein